MEKKSVIFTILFLVIIFLWLLIIGQGNGISGFFGNVNIIDEGQYAAWIINVFHGKLIYKDIFIQYGPLEIFGIYILMSIFGHSLFFVRFVTETLMTFLGIWVIFEFQKYLRVNKVVNFITLFFLLLIPGVTLRYWIGVLCIFFAIKALRENSAKYSIILGFLLALSLLITIDVFIFSSIVVFSYFTYHFLINEVNFKLKKVVIHTLLGVFCILIPFVFVASKMGFLNSYIDSSKYIITSVSGVNLPNGQGLPQINFHSSGTSPLSLIKFISSKEILFYFSAIILFSYLSFFLIKFLLRTNSKEDTPVFLTTIFSLFLYFSIIGRSGHYFLVLSFVILISGYILSELIKIKSKSKSVKFLKILFILLFVVFDVRHFLIFRYNIFSNIINSKITNNVSGVYPIYISKTQAKDIKDLQNFVKKETKIHAPIYVLNNEPGLYFLLNRKDSTKYDLPLLAGTLEKRLDTIDQLKKNPPFFIIEDKNAWGVDDIPDIKRQPEVFKYVKTNYKLFKTIDSFNIYSI